MDGGLNGWRTGSDIHLLRGLSDFKSFMADFFCLDAVLIVNLKSTWCGLRAGSIFGLETESGDRFCRDLVD